jgi:hypothetical protein
MTDHRDEQRGSFHWPPTAEELDSIQVIEMHDVDPPPAPPARPRWYRLMEHPTIAQAGLAFASLASIGIAITSLLAPAQPTRTSSRHDAPPAPIVSGSTVPVPTAPAPAAAPTTFEHRVTYDAPPPSVAEVRAERIGARAASRPQPLRAASETQKPRAERTSVVARHAAMRDTRSGIAPRPAGSDPVSRLATKTGVSVWKAMRAVGRSFRHDREADGEWSARATRAAGARRTAAAINLAADDAPSAR